MEEGREGEWREGDAGGKEGNKTSWYLRVPPTLSISLATLNVLLPPAAYKPQLTSHTCYTSDRTTHKEGRVSQVMRYALLGVGFKTAPSLNVEGEGRGVGVVLQ